LKNQNNDRRLLLPTHFRKERENGWGRVLCTTPDAEGKDDAGIPSIFMGCLWVLAREVLQ